MTVILPHPRERLPREGDRRLACDRRVLQDDGPPAGGGDDYESPIALTNTLSVPAVTDGLLDYLLGEDPEIGLTMAVNTVVAECNDAFPERPRRQHVRREHVAHAIADATTGRFEQGAVGAGRGMSSFGLKGGIGTSSRRATSPTGEAMVGILVLSNFCRLDELAVAGRHRRWLVEEGWPHGPVADAGSVIIVLATDAPSRADNFTACFVGSRTG